MSKNHLAQYDVEELQSYYSDFHKDFYGWRPRTASPAQWQSREWLEAAITAIHDVMDSMKQTVQGREELRQAGWQIDESMA